MANSTRWSMNFSNGSPYSDPQSDGLTLGASTSIPNKWKKIAQRCLQIQIPKARSHTPNQHFKATTQDAKIMKWYGFNGLDVRMENPTASKISYRFSIGIVKTAGCYYPFCVLFVSIYSWKFIIIIVVNFFPLFFPIMLLWYSYVKFSLLMSNFNLILKIDKGWIGLLKPLHFPLSLFFF